MNQNQELKASLKSLLTLHANDQNNFAGDSWDLGFRALYGGQVMSQALAAAQKTVSANLFSHSLHCYFLLPGNAEIPVDYVVERIRDGRSFCTRRVKAMQSGNEIFDALISFQLPVEGLSHQTASMPEVAEPESLEHDMQKYEVNTKILSERMQSKLHFHKALDMRTAEMTVNESVARRSIWMRCEEELGNFAMHQAALCYASDYYFLSSALQVHGLSPANKNLRLATIDHALWFHRHFNFNEWILYVTESPVSDHARAYVQGQLFKQDGTLIASATQEGLMRLRTDEK